MFAPGSQRDLFDVPAGHAYFNRAYNAPLLAIRGTAPHR